MHACISIPLLNLMVDSRIVGQFAEHVKVAQGLDAGNIRGADSAAHANLTADVLQRKQAVVMPVASL